jgi:hypothetical protein
MAATASAVRPVSASSSSTPTDGSWSALAPYVLRTRRRRTSTRRLGDSLVAVQRERAERWRLEMLQAVYGGGLTPKALLAHRAVNPAVEAKAEVETKHDEPSA